MSGHVIFIGAGPGAADLITIRGARAIAKADVVIWASSLVAPDMISEHANEGAEIYDSLEMSLEDQIALYTSAAKEGLTVARVHSGDTSLYGAIGEQIARLTEVGCTYEIIPGVSAFGAGAAAFGVELTVPEVSQSIVLTRMATRTPMPANESIENFAAIGTTMVLFLSVKRGKALQAQLLSGGQYTEDTPVAIGYRITWPDEELRRCRLGDLAATLRELGQTRTVLIMVGPALGIDPT
ncbi:precorrin-4 C(11)-methyltransferase [Stomatohabitans albus]